MTKTDPNRPPFQGAGAFVSQRRTVQTCPDRDPPFAQNFRRFFAVYIGLKGHSSRLVFSRKDRNAHDLQILDCLLQSPVLPAKNSLQPLVFHIPHSFQ